MMGTAAPPGKSVHLYRLLTLTIDQGNIVVRTIFDQAIGNVPLPQVLNNEKKAIDILSTKNIITKVQYDKLFPQAGNPPPTTADFDLTLAVCLLRTLKACRLNRKFNWNAPLHLGDTSLEADLRRMQMFRNDLAHISSTKGITQVKFTQKWFDTEQVLNRLNSSLRPPIPNLQQEIDDYKTKLLEPEVQEHIEKHIESMQASLKDLENKLQDLEKYVTKGFSDIERKMQDQHEDVTKGLSGISKRMDVFEEQKKSEETGDSAAEKRKVKLEEEYQEKKKHSQMSETKSKEFSLSKQRTKKIEHFKVPLVCWPKLHRAQKLINTLIAYCHDNEEKSEQQESDYYFPSEHVDIFVDDKTFDFACLSIKPEILVQQKTEWYCVSETVIDKMTDSCEGIFVDCNGVKLVRMTSEDTIYADHTYGNENIAADIHQNIHNMIEIVIFTPLLKKVKLLHKLQVEKAEPVNVSQVKEETENLNENKTSSDSTTLLKRKNDSTTDSSRKKKWNIERLLCEMIALIRRSSLPERLLPMIDSFETKELSKQVAQGLFEIDHTIKYCGYRYSTLYIKVELLHGSEKNQRRKDQIEKFLLRNRITDFQLEVIKSQIKEYYQAGTEIQSENERNATLGCFSIYTKGEQRSVCGLLSKHLVLGSSKIFVGDRIHFGTVIPNTNNAGGHDISAAVIVNKHTQYLDLKFKDFEQDTKPAYVLDKSDIKRLQDQPVYLRGARTELGVGTIKLLLKSSDDTEDSEITHLQLSDGSFALGKPDGKLAVKGDSGAIICMDDLDSGKICLLSMLMGEDLQKQDCIEKKYMSLFLSSGLRYLEEKTQGKFSIEETLTDKETEGED